jgi:hypothetical protein
MLMLGSSHCRRIPAGAERAAQFPAARRAGLLSRSSVAPTDLATQAAEPRQNHNQRLGFCFAASTSFEPADIRSPLNRVFAKQRRARMRQGRLMARQMIEPALLCIIAIISGMLAWVLDRPHFLAVFIAQATFVVVYLGAIIGRSK